MPLKIGSTFEYTCDFGDDWHHDIVLENRLAVEPGLLYPQCTGGARACPPEDCGGPWRYTEIFEILHDPEHPEFPELMEWIGDFQPEAFDVRLINRILMLAFARGAVQHAADRPIGAGLRAGGTITGYDKETMYLCGRGLV